MPKRTAEQLKKRGNRKKAQYDAKKEPEKGDTGILVEQIRQAVLPEAIDRAKEAVRKEYQDLRNYAYDEDVIMGVVMRALVAQPVSKFVPILALAEGVKKLHEKPAENGPGAATFNVYNAIFQAKGKTSTPSPNPSESSPYASEQPPAPLYPDVTPPVLDSGPVVLPPPGESIDEPEPQKPTDSKVITVELS